MSSIVTHKQPCLDHPPIHPCAENAVNRYSTCRQNGPNQTMNQSIFTKPPLKPALPLLTVIRGIRSFALNPPRRSRWRCVRTRIRKRFLVRMSPRSRGRVRTLVRGRWRRSHAVVEIRVGPKSLEPVFGRCAFFHTYLLLLELELLELVD